MFYVDGFNNNFGLPQSGSPGSGYHNAVHSPPNVAFMGDDTQSVVVSGPAFHFYHAWLTAAWNDGLNVRVRGYSTKNLDGSPLYDRTGVVNTSGPTLSSLTITESLPCALMSQAVWWVRTEMVEDTLLSTTLTLPLPPRP